MPQWIAYPMKNRDDWENIVKPRLDAKIPGRHPTGQKLHKLVADYRQRDYPLGLWCGSFYGWPRSFMGVERISVMFYDDPDLIHEMAEHIADFAVQILTPLLQRIDFDFAYIWEDMAGKAGPLCSPATYRQFMLGPLKRITALLHAHGVDTIIVDSDGNNDVLVPLWLEAGVTGLRPFEAAAGCDPVAIRKRYGKNLIIQGGIDDRTARHDLPLRAQKDVVLAGSRHGPGRIQARIVLDDHLGRAPVLRRHHDRYQHVYHHDQQE
jgi:uroporphyrinogen decarboxylase